MTSFAGITAAMNLPLISISIAKIFLVLFYPINAFANPFLYVFFTKVVRKNVKKRAMNNSFLRRLSNTYDRSVITVALLDDKSVTVPCKTITIRKDLAESTTTPPSDFLPSRR